MNDATPTLYDWAGGTEAFERLTETFYGKVRQDDVLEPVFRHMDREHPKHVAAWLAEVFGGPRRYTEEHGGYPHMLSKHRNRNLTEQQRRRWVKPDLRRRGRGRPAGRPRVPLGVRGIHRVGHAPGGRQLPARREPAAEGAGAPLGLGRGAALHGLSRGGSHSPGMCRTA
jgi:truncated hemoglobin YjbI